MLLTLVRNTDLKLLRCYLQKLGMKRNFLIFCHKPACYLVLHAWGDMGYLSQGEEDSTNVGLASLLHHCVVAGLLWLQVRRKVGKLLWACKCWAPVTTFRSESFSQFGLVGRAFFSHNPTWEKARIRYLHLEWAVFSDYCWQEMWSEILMKSKGHSERVVCVEIRYGARMKTVKELLQHSVIQRKLKAAVHHRVTWIPRWSFLWFCVVMHNFWSVRTEMKIFGCCKKGHLVRERSKRNLMFVCTVD